jgi:EAL domain-containing protein (putative c-di-GMP-specific phosphodiesterase class I)
LFDASMHARAVEWLTMEMDLRRALDRKEFVLHYQPIVDLKEGVTRGLEALVRWQRSDGRMVPPGEFIPLAEDTGLIVPLGEWVLSEACRQVAIWQRQFPSDPPLAVTVNVSAKQFSEPGMVEKTRLAVESSGLAPGSLRIELTESVLVETGESILAVLVGLRRVGIQLYLDDFGTGYSSLSYLHKFPIQTLKIDRSFVSRLGVEGENAAIVNTIVGLAHELGLNVIAEGVETGDQVVHLKAIRCENAQGFYFSKPMPAAAVEHFLSANVETPARMA